MSDWRKWRALPRADRRRLARAAVMLAWTRIAVRWTAVDRSAADPGAPTAPPEDLERARRLAALVAIAAARVPFSVTCLHRALVLRHLLARERIDARLRLGARKHEGGFEAHAWVECGGIAIGEPADPLTAWSTFRSAGDASRLARRVS